MKYLYAVIIIIVFFFGLTFTYMNSQVVEVKYLSLHKETSLAVLLLVTLIIGLVAGFVVSALSSLKARRRVRRDAASLKKQLKGSQLPGL